jgi:hypothetical protein
VDGQTSELWQDPDNFSGALTFLGRLRPRSTTFDSPSTCSTEAPDPAAYSASELEMDAKDFAADVAAGFSTDA